MLVLVFILRSRETIKEKKVCFSIEIELSF